MTYPVAILPYINSLPFRMAGPPADGRFLPMVPSESVRALRENRVLAAAVPVGALPELGGLVEPIGRYGIGADTCTMSVLFFSSRPFSEMRETDAIRVTSESGTSVRLLDVLMSDHQPETAGAFSPAAAPRGELEIGDTALTHYFRRCESHAREPERFEFMTDLATEWRRRTGLPFVFARWVVRVDAPAAVKASLGDWLRVFGDREEDLIRESAPVAARESGLTEAFAERYLAVIRRVFDESFLAGQERFLACLRTRAGDRREHHVPPAPWLPRPAAVAGVSASHGH